MRDSLSDVYLPKPLRCRARLFQGRDGREIIEWADLPGRVAQLAFTSSQHILHYRTKTPGAYSWETEMEITAGNWLVIMIDDKPEAGADVDAPMLMVLTPQEFEARYEPASDPTDDSDSDKAPTFTTPVVIRRGNKGGRPRNTPRA